jgi:uncharacterized membrane protein YfcA
MLDLLPVALFFAAALLFTSVGHGGASGYLAVMGLLGFAPSLMRSTALSLNIAAAGIALLIFMTRAAKDSSLHAGHFARRLLPFLITSLPMSYLGGQLNLHGNIHKAIVGIVLLWAAWQLFKPKKTTFETTAQNYDNPWWVWPVGAAIGFVSGLTGVGGGIFLSPLLVLTGLSTVRQSAPLSAAFILLNSITGLLGVLSSNTALAPQLPVWLTAVSVAAIIGASWGSRTVQIAALRKVLAMVLVVAGIKLIAALLGT